MSHEEESLARERHEIAARVARFAATQQRFARERHDYHASTLGSAWRGYQPMPSAAEQPTSLADT